MTSLIPLVVAAILAVLIPFGGVVILSTMLLATCKPRSFFAAAVCFVIPAIAVPAALIAANTSSAFWRYSAQGPIIWFIVWPVLLLVGVGVIAAGFAVAAIRKRLIVSPRRGAATHVI